MNTCRETREAYAGSWTPLVVAAMALAAWLFGAGAMARAEERRFVFSAAELWSQGVADRVILRPDQNAISLASGVLYEDDGPAAGYSYRPNVETLGPNVWIKKQLVIAHPAARAATLLVGQGGALRARVNGQDVTLDFQHKVGNYWRAYSFPVTALRTGLNDIVLFSGTNESALPRERPQVWIARDDEYAAGAEAGRRPPNRSWKSEDDGKTWRDRELGDKANVDGEYYVRLFLNQHHATGSLTSPVLDVGANAGAMLASPIEQVKAFRISARTKGNGGGRVRLAVRTGSTLGIDTSHWSDWFAADATTGVTPPPRGRYFQFRATLETDDPTRSPELESIAIAAEVSRGNDWTTPWRVTASDNPPRLKRSPIPFRYETFTEPRLKMLREQQRLDEVVRGAQSQFEIACRLAAWSSGRWGKLGHLSENYPPWDALEILAPHADGTPVGGFCQQFNLVFLQACLSFGLTARAVSVGPGNLTDRIRSGHETVEVWSNEHRKWIYLDGNTAWYVRDQATQIPLSLWELRSRQLDVLAERPYAAIDYVRLAETPFKPELTAGFGFVELRYLPRNNFLSQPVPLPLNQGMRGWFWPEHWGTGDDRMPPTPLYHHHVTRQDDAEWTLNTAQVALEPTATAGQLRVHFDSVTPGWDANLVRVDTQPESVAGPEFVWTLRPGTNRLQVTPRNILGQRGVTTFVEIGDRRKQTEVFPK